MDAKLTVVKGSTIAPAKAQKQATALSTSTAATTNSPRDTSGSSANVATGADSTKKKTYISKESMAHMRIR